MSQSPRPNILLIHCHDLGTWLSCYDMPSIPSPNLQRFADQSIVFESAFSTAPLCTPARSSIFTGKLPHENGLMGLTHAGWRYHPGVTTLPEMLRPLGYQTALIGFQHEDFDPRVLGYDEVHGLGFLPRALVVSHRTQWWLEQPRDEAPFFLTVGLWEVHRPWPVEDYPPTDPSRVDVPPYLPDNVDTREDISQFQGSIRQMDEAVGQILEALARSEHADNTLVIFTTDHGVAFPRAKSTLYDTGVQVALIARPPAKWGVPAGRESSMISHLDIVPTLVELAGGDIDPGLDGISLAARLRAEAGLPEDRELVLEKTYHDRYDPIRAIRTRTTKYIRNYLEGPRLSLPIDLEESATRRGLGDGHLAGRVPEELYLLDRDPWEFDNLAQDPEYEALRQELAGRLDAHLRRTKDPVLDGDIPEPVLRHRDERLL